MCLLTANRARDDAVQENPITIRTLIACSHHALPQPKAGLLSGKNLWWGAVSQTSPVVGTLQRPASEQSVTCPSPAAFVAGSDSRFAIIRRSRAAAR